MESNGIIKYKSGLLRIGNAVHITNKLLSVDFRPLEIMHLDDHKIFLDSISKCIPNKFPNANIKKFQDSKKALEYVTNCLNNNEALDLIITGLNLRQPELDGIDFSKTVRKEGLKSNRQIPILGLDMYDDETFIQKFLNAGIVRYLTSSTSCEEINLTIENMI